MSENASVRACTIDKDLEERWMEREGLKKGTRQYKEAIECVMINAEDRLKAGGITLTDETLQSAAEEIIKEEIELTGG